MVFNTYLHRIFAKLSILFQLSKLSKTFFCFSVIISPIVKDICPKTEADVYCIIQILNFGQIICISRLFLVSLHLRRSVDCSIYASFSTSAARFSLIRCNILPRPPKSISPSAANCRELTPFPFSFNFSPLFLAGLNLLIYKIFGRAIKGKVPQVSACSTFCV